MRNSYSLSSQLAADELAFGEQKKSVKRDEVSHGVWCQSQPKGGPCRGRITQQSCLLLQCLTVPGIFHRPHCIKPFNTFSIMVCRRCGVM
ncbi:Eukaryotic translation initiation factor 3 subunit M [Frankliniella fusca]|uniref:Eukaryotic translation initiation factor 3 subunit M n=1 Tax=Frankliniella fusca TaxID=407009 RepID=A0AAE1LKR9_9NEOP|nr:Eukaryotic translation initiation factor 3 subunit M [Frankliniella fusca]